MHYRLILTICAALLSLSAKADFNNGVVALMQGEYDKALSIFVPLAETADHAYAQYFVGRMYAAGQGVDQNMETAAEWYRKASELSVADAQYRLGKLYETGSGVPRDAESTYAWYSVAAHQGNAKAIAALDSAAAALSDTEKSQADTLSADLIKKYGQPAKTTSRVQ